MPPGQRAWTVFAANARALGFGRFQPEKLKNDKQEREDIHLDADLQDRAFVNQPGEASLFDGFLEGIVFLISFSGAFQRIDFLVTGICF